jgi:hypothetical protein
MYSELKKYLAYLGFVMQLEVSRADCIYSQNLVGNLLRHGKTFAL